MYDNELKLISRSPAWRDRRGQVIYSETSRATLCEVVPISRDEYFRGAENGINAEFEFKINPIEYNHEKIVEFEGRRYSIYRTYQAGSDTLELYAEFVPGVAVGGDSGDS